MLASPFLSVACNLEILIMMHARLVRGEDLANPTQFDTLTIRVTGSEDIQLFRTIIRRATNCWDDAPPQVMELRDLVLHGQLLLPSKS